MYTQDTKFVGFRIVDDVTIPVYHNSNHGNITIESVSRTYKDKQSKEIVTVHVNHKWLKIEN